MVNESIDRNLIQVRLFGCNDTSIWTSANKQKVDNVSMFYGRNFKMIEMCSHSLCLVWFVFVFGQIFTFDVIVINLQDKID